MKVALISEWLDAWRGGAETSTLQFLHHLMDAGVDVHVFTRSRPASAPGLRVHTIPGAAITRTRQSMTFARRVESLLRNQTFDVVHAITPCRFVDIYQPRGGTVAETIERNVELRRSSFVRTVKRCANCLNLKQRYLLRMERSIFQGPRNTTVIAISEYVVRQLEHHYGVPGDRIRKIYNGVNLDLASEHDRSAQRVALRREFGIPDDAVLVLVVAHNFRLKGVIHWLEAARRLKEQTGPAVRSLIIGKDDSLGWHRLADRMGIRDVVTFVGPSDRVPEFYHAGDILVHPTFYDPCSRVVLEAMVSGLAVVTTKWDGASEMVVDGQNGFVLDDPADAAGIAARVAALTDPGVRSRMGHAAKRVAATVDMGRHAGQVLDLYSEITAGRPRMAAAGLQAGC